MRAERDKTGMRYVKKTGEPLSGAEGLTPMPKIDRAKIPFTNNASYPKEFAAVIAGREKQKLGDAVGLTQFGVNIARIKAQFQVGAAPLARERGRVHLHARRRAGAARGRRRDRAQAGRRRRLARQRRHRPLPDQPHRQATRSISKSAPARRTSACTIPTSISAWSATTRAAAGCASPASRSRSRAALPRERGDGRQFQARRRCRRHCAHHLGHARALDERDRSRGDRGTVQDRREDRRPTPRSRARSSPRARRRSAPAPI